MARTSRNKYIGFVGKNNWTDKSFVSVEYRRVLDFDNYYEKVITIHLDFASIEEQEAAWKKYRNEFEDGLYGDCNFVNGTICSAFNSCVMRYNRNLPDPFKCDTELVQQGWILDGWGRMRRR